MKRGDFEYFRETWLCYKGTSLFQGLHGWACNNITLLARFMGPTWGPPGDDRTLVGPMILAIWDYIVTSCHASCITGPLWMNSMVIGGFPSQRTSNLEISSIFVLGLNTMSNSQVASYVCDIIEMVHMWCHNNVSAFLPRSTLTLSHYVPKQHLSPSHLAAWCPLSPACGPITCHVSLQPTLATQTRALDLSLYTECWKRSNANSV